jgi:AraC-like DNA-binding protein
MAEVEMSASIGAMIVQTAAARGVDASVLTARTGFDPALAADPDARIPLPLETALWDVAAELTGDATFGVHAADGVQPGAFDVLDYAVRTAPSLRVAFQRLVRYNRLVHDAAEFTLIPGNGRLRIEHAFRTSSAVQSRQSAEFTIAAVLRISEQITESKIQPLAVELRHAPPSSDAARAELARYFGLSPLFRARVNAIEIDADVVDRPVPLADRALWRVMERHAEALLRARPGTATSTADRVRDLLASSLGEGLSTLAFVASNLKLSERSVQRHLAEQGTSFDEILDGLRRDLALRYLSDPKLAIGEVAYLLGYSEPSPFHRAFKRWTGLSPSEARRRAA